jgi:hypothetical protein
MRLKWRKRMTTEFKFPAVLTDVDGFSTVTAFREESRDSIYSADSFHPHWNAILGGLRTGDPRVWDLFDVAGGVMRSFQQVTDRVAWDGHDVLWDGDPVHDVLAKQLSRALKGGDSDTYTALAKFWEKLASNPDEHSREQAYNWLASHDFQITLDGDVVGYKGVNNAGWNGEEVYVSTAASGVSGKPSGYVNGVPVPERSAIPQVVGDVVTMPRAEVEHNPNLTCSRGLHVGDYTYARGYGDTVLEVLVNPADIVSVPTDAGGRKVRVWRYTISRVVDKSTFEPAKTVLHNENEVANSWSGDVGYKVG